MEAHGIHNTLSRFSQVYHVNHLLSAAYFKGYSGLSRLKRIEWNNRWFWPLLLSCFVHARFAILITDSCIHLFCVLLNCLCRAMSTVHAIFITAMSLYLVFWSNLYSDYSDNQLKPFVTLQSSPLSTFVLGVKMLSLIFDQDSFEMLVSALYPGLICFWTGGS